MATVKEQVDVPPPYKEYHSAWEKLVNVQSVTQLEKLAFDLELNNHPFRSICWKIFLKKYRACDPDNWLHVTLISRGNYNSLMEKFMLNTHSITDVKDNPLSQESNSVWFRHLCDVDLTNTIEQDISRIVPEDGYFAHPEMKNKMINILFYYARQNKDICYRQGMHEILTNVILTLKNDRDKYVEALSQGYNNFVIGELLDIQYEEEDAYALFEAIMSSMRRFYVIPNKVPLLTGELPPQTDQDEVNDESIIEKELDDISKSVLAVKDKELHKHLKDLNINFTVFGIRWVRLLFGREFPEDTLFLIWDVIFAYNPDFSLIYYVLIGMLTMIRDKLVGKAYSHCLGHLMDYPKTVNIKDVIDYALYTRDPKTFPNHVRKTIPPLGLIRGKFAPIARSNRKSLEEVNDLSRRFKQLTPYSSERGRKRAGKVKSANISPSQELDKCKAVMSMCKLRVEQYKDMLSKGILGQNITLTEIVGGLQELSTMMDLNGLNIDIQKELVTKPQEQIENVVVPHSPFTETMSASSQVIALNLPPPRTDVNMTVFSHSENRMEEDESKFPSENPLRFFEH